MSDSTALTGRPGSYGFVLLAHLGAWVSVLSLYVAGYAICYFSGYTRPPWYLWLVVATAPALMSASYHLVGGARRGVRVGFLAYAVLVLGALGGGLLGYLMPNTKSEFLSTLNTGVMAFFGLIFGSFFSAVGFSVWVSRDLKRQVSRE